MARVNFLTLERTKPAQTCRWPLPMFAARGAYVSDSALEVHVHANTHLHGLRRLTLSRLSGYCLRGLPGKDTIERREIDWKRMDEAEEGGRRESKKNEKKKQRKCDKDGETETGRRGD